MMTPAPRKLIRTTQSVAALAVASAILSPITALAQNASAEGKSVNEIGLYGYTPIDHGRSDSDLSWSETGGGAWWNHFGENKGKFVLSPDTPLDLKRYYGRPDLSISGSVSDYDEGKWRYGTRNLSREIISGKASIGSWIGRNNASAFVRTLKGTNTYDGSTTTKYNWHGNQVGAHYAHQFQLYSPRRSGGNPYSDLDSDGTELRLGGGLSYYSVYDSDWSEMEYDLKADLVIGLRPFLGTCLKLREECKPSDAPSPYLPTHVRLTGLAGLRSLPTSTPHYFEGSASAYFNLSGAAPESAKDFFNSMRFSVYYFSWQTGDKEKEFYPHFTSSGFSKFFGGLTLFSDGASNVELSAEREFRDVDGYGKHSVTTFLLSYSILLDGRSSK